MGQLERTFSLDSNINNKGECDISAGQLERTLSLDVNTPLACFVDALDTDCFYDGHCEPPGFFLFRLLALLSHPK